MTGQPRVPAGRAGGGRFASVECPRVYAMLDTLAPRLRVVAAFPGEVPVGAVCREEASSWQPVDAPRCVHGHFLRWAVSNCRRCAGLR